MLYKVATSESLYTLPNFINQAGYSVVILYDKWLLDYFIAGSLLSGTSVAHRLSV